MGILCLGSYSHHLHCRDRLGVVTQALFAQRDFTDLSILDDFHDALENSVRSQLTESGLYMGGSFHFEGSIGLSSTYLQVPACELDFDCNMYRF